MLGIDIRQDFRLLLKMDKMALAAQLLLLGIGVMFIYGAGRDYGASAPGRWLAQLAWIVLGESVYFAAAIYDYRDWGRFTWGVYVLGIILLLLVFVFGSYGSSARSMLRIPGANVQVSEPMKAALLLFCSYVLSSKMLTYTRLPLILLWAMMVVPPVAMILLQGDGGTALVFLPFSFAILFINGLKKRWILSALLALMIAVPIAYSHLKPYQKQRIFVFMKGPCEDAIDAASPLLPDEWSNALEKKLNSLLQQGRNSEPGGKPLDDWNARQALYSVGSGRMTGTGYLLGRQHTLGYLPRNVAFTDFIFCVIAEESGFLGALAVLGAMCLLIIFTLKTAITCRDNYGAGIAVGAAVIYATHTFINIGMCIGVAPIIGIPLPFVSYGGSCLVTMMLMAGLVQSVHIHGVKQYD